MSDANKNDSGKPPLALIPREAIHEEGKAFADGMKYGVYNYKKGLAVTRTVSAALRHIFLFLDGHDIDKDSKNNAHHLGCARAELAIALDTLKNHPELDDRYKKESK